MKTQIIISKSDDLRLRVAKAKAIIRAAGLKNYVRVFLDKYKKYDNLEAITKITGVFQLRQTDEKLTREIEAFVSELQNS